MANPEQQLVSHIVRTGDLEKALEWGIEEEDFGTDEGRTMFTHLCKIRRDPRNKGAQVGKNTIQSFYKNYVMCDDPSMTIEAYCMMVRTERLRREFRSTAQELATQSDSDDPVSAATKAAIRLKGLLSLGYGLESDVTFAKSWSRIIDRHDTQADGVDLSACKFPWEPFNRVAMGIQPDDYIVFYGRPKSMKSWVLAHVIADIYNQGKLPLVYTKEMTADNIFMRIAACIAKLPYQEFRTGKLCPEDRERLDYLRDIADNLMSNKDMICLNAKDMQNGGDTVEWLHAKVLKYQPDVVAIDGLYLMSDGRGAKNQKDNFRVQNISRATRQMVLDTGKPVLATMQATRSAAAHKNANLDEIAFSDAISQDVTMAVRVINEQEKNTITLAMGGAREIRFSGCRIHGVPATNFDWLEELDEKEINRVKQRDEKVDEIETATPTERTPVNTTATEKKKQQARIRNDAKLEEHRINSTAHLPRGMRV